MAVPKRYRYLYLLLLVALWGGGCGYRPVGSDIHPSGERPRLAIPLFGNRSTEVGLEATLASALVQTFAENRAVRLTTKPDEADYILEGTVQSVENSSVAYLDVTRSLVRRVTVRVEISLKRRAGGKVVWKDSSVFREDYVVDPNYHIGEATKSMGLRRAANNLARRVLDKVLLVI